MRITFVGDSMTIGCAGDHTWRYRMWQHLTRTWSEPFRIVGPYGSLYDRAADEPVSTDYADPAFPPDARRHFAGWGKGWRHMAPLIRQTVARHRPGLLLVSLGIIDLGFYADAEQTAACVRRFVTEARAAQPRIRIVALPVIPNIRAATDPLFAAECDRFNVLLAKAIADLDAPGSPLLLASSPPAWDVRHDTYDGTHPSAAGEHRLAAAFADAMHQAWGLGGPYAMPHGVPPEPLTALPHELPGSHR